MKGKYIFILLLFSSNIYANFEEIYTQIITNKPTIKKRYAEKLAKTIVKVSKKRHIDAKIYTAILMQESQYILHNKKCEVGYREDQLLQNDEIVTVYIEEKYCSDFGIAMIHINTLKNYNFDVEKLLNNLYYSLDAGAKVLADFQKMYGNKEKNYWSRYNASNKIKRELYEKLVSRYK